MRRLLRPLLLRRSAGQAAQDEPSNRPPAGAYRSMAYLPLRPWQVRSRRFTTRRRGLDPVEVTRFLDRVADDLAAAEAEIAASRAETARIKDALREWQSRQAPTMRDLGRHP